MGDMFNNLKNNGSITRGSGEPRRPFREGVRNTLGIGQRVCSQCKDERATGSAQMANGKWVRVGSKCKRAMKIPRGGQKPNSQISKPPKHGSGETKPQIGGGRHRL